MPIALAESIVVKMNLGVTLADISACFASDGGLKIDPIIAGRVCFEGFSHRVVAKRTSRET